MDSAERRYAFERLREDWLAALQLVHATTPGSSEWHAAHALERHYAAEYMRLLREHPGPSSAPSENVTSGRT